MKSLFITILLFSAGYTLTAQSLQVLAASGGYSEKESGSISWTLGETIIETYGTSEILLTQGFQQQKFTITDISDQVVSNIDISIYPNPTKRYLFIEVKSSRPVKLVLSLYDVNGKLHHNANLSSKKYYLDMKKYKSTTYFLTISKEYKPIRTYQILKQ